jgi:chorismate dehydratase
LKVAQMRSGVICVTISRMTSASHLPRLAASSYLNTAPLIWNFLHGSQQQAVELFTDKAPARCAEMLVNLEVDAALVPVIEYQRMPDVALIPDVCVGSRSAVRSVVLVTRRNNLKKVERVVLDESSRTSAALTKIIFREFLGFEPQWKTASPDLGAMLREADAALIIGDPAMKIPREQFRVFDLATLCMSSPALDLCLRCGWRAAQRFWKRFAQSILRWREMKDSPHMNLDCRPIVRGTPG